MSKKYQIDDTLTGVTLGVYEGKNEDEALDAMAREKGFGDFTEAIDNMSFNDDHIVVTAVG